MPAARQEVSIGMYSFTSEHSNGCLSALFARQCSLQDAARYTYIIILWILCASCTRKLPNLSHWWRQTTETKVMYQIDSQSHALWESRDKPSLQHWESGSQSSSASAALTRQSECLIGLPNPIEGDGPFPTNNSLLAKLWVLNDCCSTWQLIAQRLAGSNLVWA